MSCIHLCMRMHVLQNLGGEAVYYVSVGFFFSDSDSLISLPELNEIFLCLQQIAK